MDLVVIAILLCWFIGPGEQQRLGSQEAQIRLGPHQPTTAPLAAEQDASHSELSRRSDLSRQLLGRIGAHITFDSHIDRLAHLVDRHTILDAIQRLSVADGPGERWPTRHSYSSGARTAVQWLKTQYESFGQSHRSADPIRCHLLRYRPGLAPNLVCKSAWSLDSRLPLADLPLQHDGSSHSYSVVLTAHYDSKGSFGSLEAPGADDNASGCAVLLSIAKLIQERKDEIIKTKPRRSDRPESNPADQFSSRPKREKKKVEIIFIHSSGTEQGFIGSRSIASQLFPDQSHVGSTDPSLVLLLLNVDMISYRARHQPLQMGLSTMGCSPESLEFVRRISNIYVPELLVGNASIGVADEGSFQSIGVPNSVRLFESLGHSIQNPHYLKSSDRFSHFLSTNLAHVDGLESDGFYDINQTVLIAQVVLASLLELILA